MLERRRCSHRLRGPPTTGRCCGDPDRGRAALGGDGARRSSHPELSRGRESAVHEIPFDSDRKLMTLVYDGSDGRTAPSRRAPRRWSSSGPSLPIPSSSTLAGAWAAEGFRVLAIALDGPSTTLGELDDSVEAKLELLGPRRAPRPAAADCGRLDRARRTTPASTFACSRETIRRPRGRSDTRSGSSEADVYARATPGVEARALVEELQARRRGRGGHRRRRQRRAGAAPRGRRRGDGRSGTEAAREAASIVLTGRRLRHDRRRDPRRPPDRRTTSASSWPSSSRRTSARCSCSRSRSPSGWERRSR